MPRYFFNLDDGLDEQDHEGVELASACEARSTAVLFVGDLLRDNPVKISASDQPLRVDVRDEMGTMLFNVTVAVERPPVN